MAANGVSCSRTQVSDSPCASDTVDILLYVAGQVKVNHMLHVGDVQTPSCYLIKSKESKYIKIKYNNII